MAHPIDDLIDKDRILDVVATLFTATDDRDWPRVRDCLAPTVRFDMTSLAGGQPSNLTPEEITAAWRSGLAPLEAIHHQIGNQRIEVAGDRATLFCYGIATHYRKVPSGRNTRTFVGSYDVHLVRHGGSWRIDAFRFNLKYLDGNPDLDRES